LPTFFPMGFAIGRIISLLYTGLGRSIADVSAFLRVGLTEFLVEGDMTEWWRMVGLGRSQLGWLEGRAGGVRGGKRGGSGRCKGGRRPCNNR